MESRKKRNSQVCTRGEFLFCVVVLWTAAIFQGYALYQERREEKQAVEAFRCLGIEEVERCNEKNKEVVFTLKGRRPGIMTMDEKGEATDRMFHSLGAYVVEAVREEELYTVYGYSPVFRDSVCYGENEINLNLAFSYDEEKLQAIVAEARALEGIFYVRVWLNEGTLQTGDDIMYALVGGDIRPRVVDCLQYLVGRIKNECVTEEEIYE